MKKRLFSMILAVAILSSVFAIPVAASEVQPRYLMKDCGVCGTLYRLQTRKIQEYEIVEAACMVNDDGAMAHTHVHKVYEEYVRCSTCGESSFGTYIKVYCRGVYLWTVDNR